MMQSRDSTYITAHFVELEIAHLTRMIRSRHWHGSKAWTVSYWRARLEDLKRAPVVSTEQCMKLEALLDELEHVAATLEHAVPYREAAQHANASRALGSDIQH